MMFGRHMRGLCLIDDLLYAFGGYIGYSNPMRESEVYRISQNRWSAIPDLVTTEGISTAAHMAGMIYLTGYSQERVHIYDIVKTIYSIGFRLPKNTHKRLISVDSAKLYAFASSEGVYEADRFGSVQRNPGCVAFNCPKMCVRYRSKFVLVDWYNDVFEIDTENRRSVKVFELEP
jgi:hypothetical protein